MARRKFDDAAPIGSLKEAGLDRDRCFHYSSRFEPYLAPAWGNDYIVKAQDRLGLQDKTGITNDLIWYANVLAENDTKTFPYISWSNTSVPANCPTNTTAAPIQPSTAATTPASNKHRVAFVLRCYQGFTWSQDAILHLRALIWELRTAKLPFEVDVHLLFEVKGAASYVSMFTESGRKRVLRGSVPIEFWSMVTMWSEQEMILRYPLYGDFRNGIRAADSYRGCLLALQRFATQHTEYDSFINWELDTRFTHTYDLLLESIWKYAHQTGAQTYTRWPVQGSKATGDSKDSGVCKDKSADVVVFSPIRNPQNSGWYWEYDVQGYPSLQSTPRAASVGTNMWLSKRTLFALENITADQHQSLFCEAMVPTLVLHSSSLSLPATQDQCSDQLKLVHYPHPIAFAYQASPEKLDQLLNPSTAILAKHREEVLKDTSYYYASTIAGEIYGKWEREKDACILPMLLHPVKGSVSRVGKESGFGWGASKGLGLCDESKSADNCAEIVKGDIQRYLGKDVDAGAQKSLVEWDLRGEKYISRRTWIMNSSSRSLVKTIGIWIPAFVVCRVLIGFFSRASTRRQNEYIPLPAN